MAWSNIIFIDTIQKLYDNHNETAQYGNINNSLSAAHNEINMSAKVVVCHVSDCSQTSSASRVGVPFISFFPNNFEIW
jgi:hypothetical protein